MSHFAALLLSIVHLTLISASPAQKPLSPSVSGFNSRFFDVQAHRGGRGNTVESTLPSFAWGLVDGATTLELDNGITLDGETIVWHDEEILPEKCLDTAPILPGDPMFPYVGKLIANLTLAQIKTLDCGSKRQGDYPQQLLYPRAHIPTLREVFDFVECADPSHCMLWNIESKINPRHRNRTAGVDDFAQKQHAIFSSSPYYRSITYQSFDWRTLLAMRTLDLTIPISALIDGETALMPDNSTSPWLAGLRLDAFPGPFLGAQMAQAAHAIDADILSPAGTGLVGYADDSHNEPLTTKAMIKEAHKLGLEVKPWTINHFDRTEELVQWGVDGIITDYPNVVRRWAKATSVRLSGKAHAEGHVKIRSWY